MSIESKRVETLTVSDIQAHPVWQYVNNDQLGETAVRPIKRIPVKNLLGRVVGTPVLLANGNARWALIGNIDTLNPRLTKHFLTISLEREGKWFTLARYHDADYSQRGPSALADFLGLDASQVFPLSYDISHYAEGDVSALVGKILREPDERLTRAEIIQMAVP
jgi:hypothetical protein